MPKKMVRTIDMTMNPKLSIRSRMETMTYVGVGLTMDPGISYLACTILCQIVRRELRLPVACLMLDRPVRDGFLYATVMGAQAIAISHWSQSRAANGTGRK